ncbi:GNAT family N-acetyltransferase [Thiosulfativibrio zosterae]|uniref:N-acetyltransferase n=1 Tax=Thiosulfativibrio zosterae TaxID=2675053 RepID=A0A6F8PMF7_9GAMM|nr:GNAT family N-acetyltransferase [Thiosulfativibrio zosterae]BBP43258.1 hypothetical protein THMIRHAT_10040 [Thiosulfativibrio zosterae]
MAISETLTLRLISNLADIPAQDWDAMNVQQSPFLSHAFLSELETHNCASERFGWIPCHLALYENNQLIAALPLYQKYNNYGEFVFDQSWENAWKQVGLNYYPKLLSAIPYTPALGQRFLKNPAATDLSDEACQTALLNGAQQICLQNNLSGLHILFAHPTQQDWLNEQPAQITRHDCQFHWFNQNYQSFDDFLAALTGKKRKNIRQERKALAAQGIQFRQLNGHTASDEDWANFSHFYHKTFTEKWSTPTLNEAFFKAVAKKIPEQVLLVLADDAKGNCIAGALMYHSPTHLYGRHWGCVADVPFLHFECCFYQGIEFAIQNGLQVFEPGAGGEHKIARGFVPVQTQSSHWLTRNPFPEGIGDFCQRERQMIDEYMTETLEHIPYPVCPQNPLAFKP